MTANSLLDENLNMLASKLSELKVDHAAALQPICEVLARISESSKEPGQFRRALKELAEVVIQVRTRLGSPLRFRELPVPPYDLWLPFKAKDLTPSDSEDLVEAMRIFNHKVSELAFAHGCSNEPPEEDLSDERAVSQHSTGPVEPLSNDSHGNDR